MPKVPLPLTLTEKSPEVTLYDSIADTESPIIEITVPRKQSWAFRAGDKFYLFVATAAGTQITAGTVRVYKADATGKTIRMLMAEARVDELTELVDRNKMYTFLQGFALDSDEKIIVTFEGKDVADDAQTKFVITGVKVLEI